MGIEALYRKPRLSKPHPGHKIYPYLLRGVEIIRANHVWAVSFCTEALEEAIRKHGIPDSFNSDQGSQFTSEAFTGILNTHGIKISMDGRGRWMDNVFIERLWRSVKYEDVYLKAYGSISEVRQGLREYFKFYNTLRCHQRLDRRTPDEVYWITLPQKQAAI